MICTHGTVVSMERSAISNLLRGCWWGQVSQLKRRKRDPELSDRICNESVSDSPANIARHQSWGTMQLLCLTRLLVLKVSYTKHLKACDKIGVTLLL